MQLQAAVFYLNILYVKRLHGYRLQDHLAINIVLLQFCYVHMIKICNQFETLPIVIHLKFTISFYFLKNLSPGLWEKETWRVGDA